VVGRPVRTKYEAAGWVIADLTLVVCIIVLSGFSWPNILFTLGMVPAIIIVLPLKNMFTQTELD